MTAAHPCHMACVCQPNSQGRAEIVCAHVDCFPAPDFRWDACRPNYTDTRQCCMAGYTCGDQLQQLDTCTLDGKTYYEGELMYPEVGQIICSRLRLLSIYTRA